MSAQRTALPDPTHPMFWKRPPAEPGRKAHLVGICGAGMKALAEAMLDTGWTISGCDRDPDPAAQASLQRLGISLRSEHLPDHVHPQLQALIFSPAVAADHPERQRATELGIRQLSYVEALAELTRETPSLAIAGTHGKSTTTAMLGAILNRCGRKPTVVCGAESKSNRRSGWSNNGAIAVIEACEFRKHFLQLEPASACILGIEPDHFDCYPTLAEATAAYRQFAENIPTNGSLIYRSDCTTTVSAVERVQARRVSFSLEDIQADWQARDMTHAPEGARMRVCHGSEISRPIQLRVPGRHNVQNALAAAACAGTLGLTLDEISVGLESFEGLCRRLERLPDHCGSTVIDDYAHHPTEVAAAISALREAYPGRRILCVFQPHQLSRTAEFIEGFASALTLADRIYLLPVYAAREQESELSTRLSREILERVGSAAGLIPSLDRVWSTVETDAGANTVILTLGAGTLSRIHHDLT